MNSKTKMSSVFLNGVLTENPTFRLVLGMCPTMAVTTAAINGIGMGLAATFVLIGSNTVISILRKFVPDEVRIPAFVLIICTFVTMVQMLLQAFVPSLYESLGMFIPLIVVNCIILARAEAFASKNGVLASAVDGAGMGIGFTLALTLIAGIRELIGTGTIFGVSVFGGGYEPMLVMILPTGGFLTLGILMGIINALAQRTEKKRIERRHRSWVR